MGRKADGSLCWAATGWAAALLAGWLLTGCGTSLRSRILKTTESREPQVLNQAANVSHDRGQFEEASALYARLLEIEPPAQPSVREREVALDHTPRVFVTPDEYFTLKDVAVVLHPERPLIGYHLFWDDDIDHPGDGEPSDHEVVWVAYEETSGSVTGVYAYFHGQILESSTAITDANEHEGRPWVGVQWGKHGSLIVGWEELYAESIWWEMRETYQRLSGQGSLEADHPQASEWPRTFPGSWDEFIDFSVPVDEQARVGSERHTIVSRWPNATMDQHFIPYAFCPKSEWPP